MVLVGAELQLDPLDSPGTQITPKSWSHLEVGVVVLLSNMFFMGEGHASSVVYNLLGKVAPDCPKAILQRKVKL